MDLLVRRYTHARKQEHNRHHVGVNEMNLTTL